jgi:hypothetical protein
VYVPTGFIPQAQLDDEIKTAIGKLNPNEVAHVAFSISDDSTNTPALFFRIILQDQASREDRLGDVTERVATTLFDLIRPFENWGLTPYFSFRSVSEQMLRRDPEWA